MAPLTIASTVKLSSGEVMPRIGYGAYRANGSGVYEALKAGYRLVDTAQFYDNEDQCGRAILQFLAETGTSRASVFYTTKLWQQCTTSYAAAARGIDGSLKRAGLSYADLFLIHSPPRSRTARLETWRALQDAVKAGKIRSIGVSNYGVHHLQELLDWDGLEVHPAVNQVEVHPWLPRKDIVEFCAANNIVVEAYSPLTRGVRFGDALLADIVTAHGGAITPAQVLIRWSMQKGHVPIPKSSNPDRIRSNIDVFNFALSDAEMAMLDLDSYAPVTWDPTISPL
ncbi:NADP-dependent oxidoreductase domain-containing protein [Limtongia smithiae]|uniref:NADP-dependent oxidoreductase domain-containing protein n=1 Tax=Limtongia smithiae TaxID=1125753 RepID=UPI0034CFF301